MCGFGGSTPNRRASLKREPRPSPQSRPEPARIFVKAQKRRAGQLAQEFARGERRAITLVQQQLADAGLDMDALVVKEIQGRNLGLIERIDRLITIAESRRNSSLREIDRRRAALGQTLRRSVQEIEDDKLKVIETTPVKGKNAA